MAHSLTTIGRHLECAIQIELVVEPDLCQGKGARSQRAKNRTEPFSGKIGRGILKLVAIALTVTHLFNKVCEKV